MKSPSQPVVVLAEDEPLVRLVTADLLMNAGCRVIEAANASEALAALAAVVEVDLLVADVDMPPGISGFELAREVARRWPEVAVLITSGRPWPAEGELPRGASFLPKPCPDDTLLSHVRLAAKRVRAPGIPGREAPLRTCLHA
jgi:CheY-like chemotaxis protein